MVLDSFTHFQHDPTDPGSLSNNIIYDLYEDREGLLWVGTRFGLDYLVPQTSESVHISDETEAGQALDSAVVRTIYQDQFGAIWLGCGHPFDTPTVGAGLYRYEKNSKRITEFKHDPSNQQSLIHDKLTALFEDSRGTFWVGTAGDGLHTMDREAGTFQRHTFNPAFPQQLSRPPFNAEAPFAIDHIRFISEDEYGGIWMVHLL